LTALVGAVWAGEADKPKPGASSLVSEDEVDKPGKPGVPMPRALPTAAEAEQETKDGEKPDKPAFVNPRAARSRKPQYAEPTRITWSDGKTLEGWSWRRANGPIRIFNRKAKAHEDFFLSDLKRIDVRRETETFERDWRWKNQGSSEKVFLDTGYFWNQYVTKFVTHEGETAEGDCSGQFYILTVDGKRDKWYLHKRHSGRDVKHAKREELEALVYVRSVEFTDDFLKRIEEEKKKVEAAKEAAAKPLE
jgi:hypothetical protein